MQIKESIHQTLNQLEIILHQLNDAEYTQPIALINHQTIGKHVRHIIEFFQCLVKADHFICYDNRVRELKIETSVDFTLETIKSIKLKLNHLNFNQPIILNQLIDNKTYQVQSTLGRELIYCIDHSIHHFAIIKMVLETEFPEILFENTFGVAYSTIKYHSTHE